MKYIIDTDPGIDDAIAIMMAIRNNLDVIGFTIASGNVDVEKCENNLKFIEDFLNINIPIYRGSTINPYNEGAEFAHGKDGLGYAVFPKNKTRRIEKMTAEDYIIKMSKKYQENLTIVCLGSLTNLARAIEKDSAITERIKNIVVMGCSLDEKGNSPYLEFNIKTDIEASKMVLSAPFKSIKVVTHEIAIKAIIEKDYILSLRHSEDLVSRFVASICEKYMEYSYERYKTIGIGNPDPSTIAAIIKPKLLKYINADIEVLDTGHNKVIPNENSNVKIATEIDLEMFQDIFKKTFK